MAKTDLDHSLTRASTTDEVRVHAKTHIVIASISFAYFAQLVALVGSGLLAQSIQRFFAQSGGSSSSSNDSTWLAQSITIFTVVLSPPVSQVADLWGRKWPLTISLLFGFIGQIIVSQAQSMNTVIAGYCVTGIAFGAQPLLHAVVSEVLPRRHRPMAQSVVNATAGLGAVVAIIMGGALLRYNNLENYRIYMYVSAAIFLASSLGVGLFYNPPPRELQVSLTNGQKLRRLDWIGWLLFASGLVLFCVGLSFSRNPYPWSNPRVSATFAVGLVFIIAFFVYEWRFKSDGLLNHNLFKNRNFPLALLAMFAEGLTFFAANNYLAFQVSIVTHQDLLLSGLHFAVTFITSCCIALVSGFYSSKMRSLRYPSVVGFFLILIFNICMAATYGGNPGAAFWGFAVIVGAGLGIILPSIMVIAQLCTPADLISPASALVVAVRSLGGAVGLAIFNAIFNSALSTEIPHKIADATLPLGLPPSSLGQLIGGLTSQNEALVAAVPGISPRIIGAAANALVRAYCIGFRNCWIAAASFCFVAVIASFFVYDPKDEFTAHIDAPAEQVVAEKQARIEGTNKAISVDSKADHELHENA